jgi:uncharacterized protein DUF4440
MPEQPHSATAVSTDIGTVEALEDRRIAAMLAADTTELDRLLADGFHLVHSSATIDDKESFLRRLRQRDVRYAEIRVSGRTITASGPVVVCAFRMDDKATVGGTPVTLSNLGGSVWGRQPSGWQCVHFQSTAIPAR